MRERVKRLFGKVGKPLDAMVFLNSTEPHLDVSFFYVTDVASGLFEGSSAVAFPDGGIEVFTGPLEAESGRKTPELKVNVYQTSEEHAALLKKLLGSSATVGLNQHEITYESFLTLKKALPDAEFVDVSEAVRKTRMVKDASEVEKLRQAGKIGSQVAVEIPSMLKSGMTELELAGEMEYRMNLLGASGRSFSTIVGFGAHGAEPHFAPTKTKLEKSTTMVCDFGALYQRYCSDITRSYAFGHPPKDRKAIHDCVEAAQTAALDVIRPGAQAKEVHMAAQRVIDASPWKGKFIHGLGHSVGLAVHDGIGLNAKSEQTLEAGMCLTVEPGIYVSGQAGVRIEDDIVVTSNGYEFLTTAPRGYLEVDP